MCGTHAKLGLRHIRKFESVWIDGDLTCVYSSRLVVAAGLIALAWGKPLREWMPGAKPTAEAAVSPAPVAAKPAAPPRAVAKPVALLPLATPVATPIPTVSGAWMWEKDRRAPLDAASPSHGKRP